MISEELLIQAIAHHNAARLQEAGELYMAVLHSDPRNALANHNMGVLAIQMDQPDAALPYLETALDIEPAHAQFWLSYVDALRRTGQIDEARQILELARKQGLEGAEVESLGARLNDHALSGFGGNVAQPAPQEMAQLTTLLKREHDLGSMPKGLRYADAERFFDQAVALKNAGRLEEAAASYRTAISIDPSLGTAYYNLGNILAALGQLDAAAENLRHAVQRSPDHAAAHNNLGIVLHKLHRDEASERSLRQALRIDSNDANAHFNLGNTLRSLDRPDEAQSSYRRALKLQPDNFDALAGIVAILHQQGRYAEAMDIVLPSLRIHVNKDIKRLFVACIKNLQIAKANDETRALLVRALTEPWGRPAELMRTALQIIKHDLSFSIPLAGPPESLLLAALGSAPVCDIELERWLTRTRSQLLDLVCFDRDAGVSPEFLSALACQCFINEYVFSYADDEMQKALALRNRVEHALDTGTPISEQTLLILACYIPLHTICAHSRIPIRAWSAPATRVITQQVQEPAEEQRLRATLLQLTPITDAVSQEVQYQYEESPYPRWVKFARLADAKPLCEYLREKFPLATIETAITNSACEILVAGCGTGQHPIATAQRVAGAKVLAIDLSRSSLSYAKRKAAEMGVTSIDFAQADLLQIGAIGKTFDVIESVGVLHHLDDPCKGWRALLTLLRPGGFMKLGLYSELARRDVAHIRNELAVRGYPSTPEEIRTCRQELIRHGESGQFKSILSSPDFFSTSACRDLLFHVQEHRMTLDQIAAFLREQKLQFLGFELEQRQLSDYLARFPKDRVATNLEQWNIFEAEHPQTFGSMYQFWIQKPLT